MNLYIIHNISRVPQTLTMSKLAKRSPSAKRSPAGQSNMSKKSPSAKQSPAKQSIANKSNNKSPSTKRLPIRQSPAQSTISAISDMPGLEAILEEPYTHMPNKYVYVPLIETKTLYVHPDARITSEVMTDFEYNHIVGLRAQQLANELKSFTEINDLSDPIEIAKLEIANKRCPLSIRRVRTILDGRDIAELWDVNEMSIP